MKQFAFQIILLLAVIFGALYFYKIQDIPTIPFIPQEAVIKTLTINNARLKVEIADTKEKRSKGLGGREKLATDEGMLFIFEKAGRYPFWMKGLTYPLDFIWINKDTVLDITPNVQSPLPGQADQSLPIYTSEKEIDKVLEVNGGTVQKLNIKIGDSVKIE